MRYVKNEPSLGILLRSEKATQLTVFYDTDWAGCPNLRRSINGYIMELENL